MLKMAVQQGRSKRRDDAYSWRYVEPLSDVRTMLADFFSILLKPVARIAIIDFYPDERSGDLGFPKHHLVSRDTVIQEMTAAGYQLVREHSFLPKQYFLEFVPK